MYLLPDKGTYEKLDYVVDWSKQLADGDKIVSCNVVSDLPQLKVSRISYTDSVVTFWLEGGKLNTNATLSCIIKTQYDREIEAIMLINIVR
jgi:hypothetical protein